MLSDNSEQCLRRIYSRGTCGITLATCWSTEAMSMYLSGYKSTWGTVSVALSSGKLMESEIVVESRSCGEL